MAKSSLTRQEIKDYDHSALFDFLVHGIFDEPSSIMILTSLIDRRAPMIGIATRNLFRLYGEDAVIEALLKSENLIRTLFVIDKMTSPIAIDPLKISTLSRKIFERLQPQYVLSAWLDVFFSTIDTGSNFDSRTVTTEMINVTAKILSNESKEYLEKLRTIFHKPSEQLTFKKVFSKRMPHTKLFYLTGDPEFLPDTLKKVFLMKTKEGIIE